MSVSSAGSSILAELDEDAWKNTRARLHDEVAAGAAVRRSGPSQLWRRAVRAALASETRGYTDFPLTVPTERARRYTYHEDGDRWTCDHVLVKMEAEPFAQGTQRRCFRLLKLSKWVNSDWGAASALVAKEFFSPGTNNEAYFGDVKMQMIAKAFAEAYNQRSPPKKIDVVTAWVLELLDRPGAPVFLVERYIRGDFEKHNNNAGSVADERLTPQCFSHFSFEHSRGQRLVCDVQGVEDLFSDPQIHTLDGKGFGDGNLGVGGMALFFSTHRCNPLCKLLGLAPVPLFSATAIRLAAPLAGVTVPRNSAAAPAIVLERDSTTVSDDPPAFTVEAVDAIGSDADSDSFQRALGLVHAQIGAYLAVGRWDAADHDGTVAHCQMAALCGNAQACANLAKLYSSHELPDAPLEDSRVDDDDDLALALWKAAARLGDPVACKKMVDLGAVANDDDKLALLQKAWAADNSSARLAGDIAALLVALGRRDEARDMYMQAGELAMAEGKPKMATKFFEEAEAEE